MNGQGVGVEKDRRLVGLLDEGVAVARRVSRLAEPANQCDAEQVRRVIFDSPTSNRFTIHVLTSFAFWPHLLFAALSSKRLIKIFLTYIVCPHFNQNYLILTPHLPPFAFVLLLFGVYVIFHSIL